MYITQLINEDKQFKSVADNDYNAGVQSLETEVASITTREIQYIDAPNTDKFMKVDIPEAYRVDAKPFIERPFYIGSASFTTTQARYSLLTSNIKFLPGDVARSNTSLLNMFKMAAYGRPDLVLNISMAGTISHAGCILAAVLPPLPAYPTAANVKTIINTALTGPHAFLNANEATSVALPVPWFCNTDLATLDMQVSGSNPTVDITATNGNYATLVFIVMNPLAASSGATTTLNIVMEACFKHFDMVVPTPRFVDWLTQSSKTKKQKPQRTMLNPNYIYQEGEVLEINEVKRKRRNFNINRTQALTIASTLATVVFGVTKLVTMCVAEDVETLDFKPQAGVVSTLFDTVAGGLKKAAGDAIDAGRGYVRAWTGLHNPNNATIKERLIVTETNFHNNVDVEQHFEKLDPDANFNRITKEPLFGTALDEMAITHITQKDQYLGTFIVGTADQVGKLLWIRPISPFQGGYAANSTGRVCANNLELLHSMHRAWRGGLKIKIQSVMNNKQQVKLKVLKFYNPSINALTSYPSYASAANAPSHLLEFTQGGQMHEVCLPYLNRNDLQATCENMDAEALMHGLYYVYVAQPLVVADGSPTSVEFNVYMSGDADLTFYGYTKTNTYHEDFNLYNPVVSEVDRTPVPVHKALNMNKEIKLEDKLHFEDEEGDRRDVGMLLLSTMSNMPLPDVEKHKIVKDGKIVGVNVPFKWIKQSGNTVEVMNKPQEQKPQVRRDDAADNITHFNRLKPNLDMRPLFRRMYKSSTTQYLVERDTTVNTQVPLGSFLGELPWFWSYTPIETLSRMYYGKNVGFKLRFVIHLARNEADDYLSNLDDLSFRAYYVPQNLSILSTSKVVSYAGINANSFTPFTVASPIGEIPMTASLVSRDTSNTSITYEFVIPNTSFYKFLGSPEKFRNFSGSATPSTLSTLDFGTVLFQLVNSNPTKRAPLNLELFCGLTDESRFGFHAIAPCFSVSKTDAYYLGNNTDNNAPPTLALNTFIYRGGFL